MKNNHIKMTIKKHSNSLLCLVVLTTIMFPFANLLDIIYPAKLFGKSTWIVLPIIIIFLHFIYILASERSELSVAYFIPIAIVTLSWLIFSVRVIVYKEESSYIDFRFIATSLLFIMYSHYLIKFDFIMRIMTYAVVIQGILVAIFRSVNYYFFPNYQAIRLDNEDFFIDSKAEYVTRDLLLDSSISANHIVCGMFILLIINKYDTLKSWPVFFLFIQIFMMISTFNSLSRFPISVACLLFVLSLYQTKMLSEKTIIFTVATLLILSTLINIEYSIFFDRFTESEDFRYDKFQILLQLIQNSVLDFFIGSSSMLATSVSINGVLFSDNSYGLIAISFGVPFMLIYVVFLFSRLLQVKTDTLLSLLFLIYIVVGLGITNSILWEPWVYTAFLGFHITYYYSRLSNNTSKPKQRLQLINRML